MIGALLLSAFLIIPDSSCSLLGDRLEYGAFAVNQIKPPDKPIFYWFGPSKNVTVIDQYFDGNWGDCLAVIHEYKAFVAGRDCEELSRIIASGNISIESALGPRELPLFRQFNDNVFRWRLAAVLYPHMEIPRDQFVSSQINRDRYMADRQVSPNLRLTNFTRVSSHFLGGPKGSEKETGSGDRECHHYPLSNGIFESEQLSGPIPPIWHALAIISTIIGTAGAIGCSVGRWVYRKR